ncbi:MAG TPA: DUF2306 domain-containing protein [Segetibacter sp.]|jgi:hypothetical protein
MNSRFITLQKTSQTFTFLFFWLPVTFFSLLLIRNTIPYFSFSKDFSFIEERAVLFLKPIYNFSFYIHIFAGMFCIGTALLQFSSYILKKRKAIHVWGGRIYVIVVLLLGAPTGMYMSFFAKGGIAEKSLFMFMAVSWFLFTLFGFTSILQKQVLAHKVWMIRSYAMAMTAVTFRIYYIILYLFDVEVTQNYEVSLWISVIGNMLFAEYIIWKKSKDYIKTFTT